MDRIESWRRRDIPSQVGRLALVTGATQGLGYEIAAALAAAGADVLVAARSAERADGAVARIRRLSSTGEVRGERLDLADLASVRALAGRLLSRGRPLDLLVNNAGILTPAERRVTTDGFEAQFQINYLGHFALTALLLPLLRQAPAARVTHVSSLAGRRGRMHFDDLQFERGYRPLAAYSQSKLANLLFAFELQRRSTACGWHLRSTVGHPGFARTNLVANSRGIHDIIARLNRWVGPLVTQPCGMGALPLLYAATAPDAEPMAYYGPAHWFETRGPVSRARVPPRANREDDAQRLWRISERLSQVSFPG